MSNSAVSVVIESNPGRSDEIFVIFAWIYLWCRWQPRQKTIGSTNFYYPIPTYEISGTTQKTSGDGTFRHRSLHF